MGRLQEHRAGLRMGTGLGSARRWQRRAARALRGLPLVAACAALLIAAAGQVDAQETSLNALRNDPKAPAEAGNAPNTEHVLLQEVMPTLAGTAEGAVPVAQAPGAGTSLTISRSDVQRALAQAGMRESLKAKDIPKSVKVSREALKLTREDLSVQASEAVRVATAPCSVGEVRYPNEVRVHAGPRKFRAEFNGLRNGSMTGALFIQTSGRETRVPVIASVICPPPEIAAGAQVIAVAQVGPVKATAPAEARQAGRVGEIIRITNRATGASLRARILSSRTVEVVP